MYGKMRFLVFFGGVIFPSLVLLVGGRGVRFQAIGNIAENFGRRAPFFCDQVSSPFLYFSPIF